MLYLNVDISEKDEVKKLGGKWNQERRKWYVEKQYDYSKFAKWILNGRDNVYVVCDYIYLVVGQRVCHNCKKRIPVITFAIEKSCNIWDRNRTGGIEYYNWIKDGNLHIMSYVSEITGELADTLAKRYNYYLGFSSIAGKSYMTNHCSDCKKVQGDFYLMQEVDGPFFIDSKEKAKRLDLYKIKLSEDIIMDAELNFGSNDWMIKKYANMLNFRQGNNKVY